MQGSVILPIWRSGEIESLSEVLADDATFSSPVTDYHGKAHVAHMLGLIASVLDEIDPTSSLEGDGETAVAFSARASHDDLQGMLIERREEPGGLVHVTLFLRPYATLGKAIQRMREVLAENPLPRRGA